MKSRLEGTVVVREGVAIRILGNRRTRSTTRWFRNELEVHIVSVEQRADAVSVRRVRRATQVKSPATKIGSML